MLYWADQSGHGVNVWNIKTFAGVESLLGILLIIIIGDHTSQKVISDPSHNIKQQKVWCIVISSFQTALFLLDNMLIRKDHIDDDSSTNNRFSLHSTYTPRNVQMPGK